MFDFHALINYTEKGWEKCWSSVERKTTRVNAPTALFCETKFARWLELGSCPTKYRTRLCLW